MLVAAGSPVDAGVLAGLSGGTLFLGLAGAALRQFLRRFDSRFNLLRKRVLSS
jgi:hypothetical protein